MRRRPNPAVIVVILIMLVAIAGAATYFIKKHIPTNETMDLKEYFGEVQNNEAILVIGDAIQEQRAILGNPEAGLTEENIYLPQYVVTEALNQRFYWDAENRQILTAVSGKDERMMLDAILTRELLSARKEYRRAVWLYGGSVKARLRLARNLLSQRIGNK